MQLSPTTNVMAGPQWVEFKKEEARILPAFRFFGRGRRRLLFFQQLLEVIHSVQCLPRCQLVGSRDESASNTGCAIVSKRPVCTGTSGAPRLGAATGDESLEISRNESVDEPSSSRVSCSCARCSTSVGIPASLATCKP